MRKNFENAVTKLKKRVLIIQKEGEAYDGIGRVILRLLQGYLTIHVYTDVHTAENAAEILLEINSLMEQGNVPFHTIDLTLRSSAGEYYSLNNFLRADIYEDGLIERVKDNVQKTKEYYAELDAKR